MTRCHHHKGVLSTVGHVKGQEAENCTQDGRLKVGHVLEKRRRSGHPARDLQKAAETFKMAPMNSLEPFKMATGSFKMSASAGENTDSQEHPADHESWWQFCSLRISKPVGSKFGVCEN